jgi:hypothetical protein
MTRFWLSTAFRAALLAAAPITASATAPVCLSAYRIDHTDVPDDGQILFTMRDHAVYQAKMIDKCVGLRLDSRGFTYEPTPGSDEICANLFTIRLNTSGAVCMVGDITRIKPPK